MAMTAADIAGIIHDRLTDLHDQSDGRTFHVTVEEVRS